MTSSSSHTHTHTHARIDSWRHLKPRLKDNLHCLGLQCEAENEWQWLFVWHTNPPLEPTRDYHPPSQLVKNLAQIKRVIKFPQNAGAEQYRYLCTGWLSVGFHSHELNPDNGWSEIQQDLLKHPVCDSSRCLNFKSFAPSSCLSFACLSVYGICSLFYFSCLQFSCLQFSKCRKIFNKKCATRLISVLKSSQGTL